MLKPLILFAIWVGYGIWRARSARELRDRAFRLPRSRRLAQGIGLLVLSLPAGLGPIGAAFWISSQNGNRESAFGWAMVALGGFLLVHLQVVGITYLAATMVEDRVTERRAETSVKEGPPE